MLDECAILFLNIYDLTEYEAVYQALRAIREKERYILLARVVEEKSFSEIASELHMGYKGAAAIYYRTIEKLRRMLGDDFK